MTDRVDREEASNVKVRIFTHLTGPTPENMLERYAMLYMSGFNNTPWDVYQWRFTPERAREEFTRLFAVVLSSGGALVSLMSEGKPAGFGIAASLGLFVRELKKIEGHKRLPRNYRSPGRYFETLSRLLTVPLDEFETIGYIADVVVDAEYRGKGYGKTLITASLEYLKGVGKKYALAWTVNPTMAGILSREGFKLLDGIGDQGEGLDCTVHNGVWYPTLVIPPRRRRIPAPAPVVAWHYLKIL